MKNKKILILMLTLTQLFSFSLVGCGSSEGNTSSDEATIQEEDAANDDNIKNDAENEKITTNAKETAQIYWELTVNKKADNAYKIGFTDEEAKDYIKEVESIEEEIFKNAFFNSNTNKYLVSEEKISGIVDAYRVACNKITFDLEEKASSDTSAIVVYSFQHLDFMNLFEKSGELLQSDNLPSNISESEFYELYADKIIEQLTNFDIKSAEVVTRMEMFMKVDEYFEPLDKSEFRNQILTLIIK